MAGSIIVELPGIRRRGGLVSRKEVRLDCRSLIVAIMRPSQNAIEQFLFDIKKAETKISHEPLEGGTSSKIKSRRANINRRITGSLYDIGINICAMRVGQIANGFQVMLKS